MARPKYRWSAGAKPYADASVIAQILGMYRGGTSVLKIVEHLNQAGIPSHRGRVWRTPIVYRILRREGIPIGRNKPPAVWNRVKRLRQADLSAYEIAEHLNRGSSRNRYGGLWTANSIGLMVSRYGTPSKVAALHNNVAAGRGSEVSHNHRTLGASLL